MNRVSLLIVSMLVLSVLGCAAAPTPVPPAKPTVLATTAVTQAATSTSPTAAPKPTSTAAPLSFAGKTITIVVPQSAGGASDITARMYARYLPQYLPGKPIVAVRNMPGASGTIGSNYAYSARPDGLTALLAGSTAVMPYIMRSSVVRYDLQKMELIIGGPEGAVYYVRPGIVTRAEDLPTKAKNIIYGGGGGAIHYIFVPVMDLLDFHPQKVIFAFDAAGALRAILGGESNMGASSITMYWSAIDPYVQKGEIQPVFQAGTFDEKGNLVRVPSLPGDIPTFKEVYERIYGKTPAGIAWDVYRVLVAGRYEGTLFLPPNVPDNIVNAYRDAAEKMVKDSEFLKAVASVLGKDTPFLVGKAFSDAFTARLTMEPEVLGWLKAKMRGYGVVLE